MQVLRLRCSAALLALLVCWVSPLVKAEDEGTILRNKIQAAYVYHFTKFIQWPNSAFASADSPLRICVAVADDDKTYYSPLGQRTTAGRAIEVIYKFDTSNVSLCHMVVIGQGPKGEEFEVLLTRIAGEPVLTVSEIENFIELEGMIQFVLEAGKVRLSINLEAIKKSDLTISSKLLEVALQVYNEGDKRP